MIGILALQGCVDPHKKHLERLGAAWKELRLPRDLENVRGIILPGGESTTMLKLLKQAELWGPLQAKAKEIPFWGICAGAILMAKTVENPAQESLQVMSVNVKRNAYGRQRESFSCQFSLSGSDAKAEAVFIRAPKFLSWGSEVKARAEVRGDTVFLDDGRHMITAFHPELTDNSWCHEIFLGRTRASS